MSAVLGRPQEYASALLIEALQASLTVEAAASKLGCTSAVIHIRGKQDLAVRLALAEQAKQRETRLAQSILSHRGILSQVATELGLRSGVAVRYHITRNRRLQEVFREARENITDIAEDNVFKAVESGSVKDSWKLLTTLGKDRGYTERREVETTVTGSVELTPSSSLVSLLESMAEGQRELVEAEFSELPVEDRKLLEKALKEHAPADVEQVGEAA